MGFTRFKGNIYPGRHDPLVDGDVFGRVQEVISIRATGERERTHHHYLKSTLYCGNCHTGEDAYGRIIIAHVNGRGGTYDYFFCRRSQEKLCDAPYMQMARVEDAVARYWGRLEVSAAFIEAARVGVRRAVEKGQATARSLHTQLTENFRKLDQQEENLLDLAADGTLPHEVVQKRMNAILRNRAAMNTRLEKTEQKLAAVVDYLDAALSLLERPGELYANATDEQRRMLNQAVFSRIYVYADDVTDVEFNEPFDMLMAAGELFENPMKTAPEDRGGDVSAQAANL